MVSVGVVAHARKVLGGGLPELRETLAQAGISDPIWYEVPRSGKARKKVLACLARGVGLLIVWGGDGMVQRCIDAVLRSGRGGDVVLAIVPAGTANLLATNLGIPRDVRQAVDVALHGVPRRLDAGLLNKEHFAVMAGTGFDALMMRDADQSGLKDKLRRVAYLWAGARNLGHRAVHANIELDGQPWFRGRASCVLLGNVGTILAGVHAFPHAQPDDGLLDVGVVRAKNFWEWVRVLVRTGLGQAEDSPLVNMAQARKIAIRLGRKLPYQLDGGARGATDRLKARVHKHAIRICVPVQTVTSVVPP